jgi:hypothetical protein
VHSVFEMVYKLNQKIVEVVSSGFQIVVNDHVNLKDDWFAGAIANRWRIELILIPANWRES